MSSSPQGSYLFYIEKRGGGLYVLGKKMESGGSFIGCRGKADGFGTSFLHFFNRRQLRINIDSVFGSDWVFSANTEYRRSDGVKVGVTDSFKVFGLLSSGICSSSAVNAWTGLGVSGTDWVLGSGNCTNWTDGTQYFSADTGNMSSTNPIAALNSDTPLCDSPYKVCCIEQ